MAANVSDQRSIDRAFALHRNGQYAEAEAQYRALLVVVPEEPRVLSLLGTLCLQTGRPGEAIDLLRQAAGLEPGNAATHANLGLALLERGDHVAALASCDRALALAPAYPEALNNRGNALAGLGRTEEALTSYERALGLRRDYVDAHYNRGRMLEELHRVGEAVDAFARVLELQPHHVDALFRVGESAAGTRVVRKTPLTITIVFWSCDRTLPRCSATAAMRCSLWATWRKHSRAMSARLQPRPNWRRDTTILETSCTCSDATTKRWLPVPGQLHSGRTLRRPTTIGAAYWWRSLDRRTRCLTSSARLRSGRRFAEAHANRGNALSELRRYGQASASYARSVELDPDYAGAYCGRGTMLMDLQQYGKALADFDRAIALDPRHAFAFGNRAFALRMLGRPEEACRDLTRVLELSPRHPYAEGGRLHFQLQCCDWTDLEQRIEQVRSSLRCRQRGGVAVPLPGDLRFARGTAGLRSRFRQGREDRGVDCSGATAPCRHDRVRVAYLSADFTSTRPPI